MTYSTFRSESLMRLENDYSYCILDEGHKIRNPDAKCTISVKSVRTKHRLLLTGAARGESVINCPSPLNVLKDTYDHSCC